MIHRNKSGASPPAQIHSHTIYIQSHNPATRLGIHAHGRESHWFLQLHMIGTFDSSFQLIGLSNHIDSITEYFSLVKCYFVDR